MGRIGGSVATAAGYLESESVRGRESGRFWPQESHPRDGHAVSEKKREKEGENESERERECGHEFLT